MSSLGGQPGVELDEQRRDPTCVRPPTQNAEQVTAIASAGADHPDRVGSSRVEVPVDLGAYGSEPVRQSRAGPGVFFVPLHPIGIHGGRDLTPCLCRRLQYSGRLGKVSEIDFPRPLISVDFGAWLSVGIYSVEDMQTTQPQATSVADATDEMSAREVLDLARTQQRAEDAAAARKLHAAALWADLHPPESLHQSATYALAGIEHEEAIAGPGCPSVAEFCIAELGTVLGISTTSAKRLIGHSLELRHRLPRLWVAVHAGQVPAWRARLVAEATIHATPALTPDSVAWIDAQITPYAAKVGPAQLDRLVAEAIARQHPTEPVDPDDPHPVCPDSRHVTIDAGQGGQVGYAGTSQVTAELDLADGLDLDHALRTGAAELKALGSQESLDARRATALGHLARHQLALDLATGTGLTTDPGSAQPASTDNLPAARALELHLHFKASLTDGLDIDPFGRMDEGQRLLLLDLVKSWCGDSHTRINIKPVIDLNTDLHTPGYEPTDRQREQIALRDRSCVFPWCSHPARRSDIDHTIPFDHHSAAKERPQPGPTITSNLGALCRRHHRLKTHRRWRVQQTSSGVFEWTSPHGHTYRRDQTGTARTDADPDPPDHRLESDRRH